MIKKIYDKLNALPAWISYVAVFLACFITSIPLIINFDSMVKSMLEAYSSAGIDVSSYLSALSPAWKYIVAVISAFVSWGFMELIAAAVYSFFIRSGYRSRGQRYYSTSVRYSYALYRTVTGLYSLTAIWAPQAYNYGYDILNFIMLTAVFTVCYLGIKEECVNDLNVFNVYYRLFNIYFIFEGVITVLDLILTITDASYGVGAKVVSGVMVALVLGAGTLLYFTVFKKLKKEQTDARNDYRPPSPPPSRGGDDEIFRGYGV